MRAIGVIVGLVMLGASLAQSGCVRRPATAAGFARQMQSLVGRTHGDTEVRSVEAEGNVLVITLDGKAGWRQAMPSYAMTAFFVDRICEDPKAAHYFENGRRLRLDSTEGGAYRVRGAPLDHCPPPSTSPLSD